VALLGGRVPDGVRGRAGTTPGALGELPTDGLRVDVAELRTEVEQQALGKLLQLRQGVLAAGGSAKRQLELLEVSLSTLMVIFRGVARLHGEAPPTDYEALSRWTGGAAGFDPGALRAGGAPRARAERVAPGDAEEILSQYLAAMEALVPTSTASRARAGAPSAGTWRGARAPGAPDRVSLTTQ
jgi:hypothetical protein